MIKDVSSGLYCCATCGTPSGSVRPGQDFCLPCLEDQQDKRVAEEVARQEKENE